MTDKIISLVFVLVITPNLLFAQIENDPPYKEVKTAEGTARYYYESGNIVAQKTYWNNGNLREEIHFQNGLLHGESKTYYENGQLNLEANFKNGQMDGSTKQYSKDGTLLSESTMSDGKLVETRNTCEKSIQFVFARWNSGTGNLTVKAFDLGDYVVDLTDHEVALLEENGISGNIEVKGSGTLNAECKSARVVFLLQELVKEPVELPLPDGENAIYVQQNNEWILYPATTQTLERNIKFEPFADDPKQIMYHAETMTGAKQGGGINLGI